MSADNRRLSLRFTVLVGIVSVLAIGAYVVWTLCVQDGFAREKALVEARTLNLEMQASWDYIDASQDAINYNSDGTYDFKHIYCSVAGKNIAQRFTNQADGYEIRFARENPRSGIDAPDDFEQAAIEAFRTSDTTEFYDITEWEGESVFRYASALEIKNNCLQCHGTPVGEKDETGYFKEGMAMGDLAGITSIIVPLNTYNNEAQTRIAQGVIFFLLLAAATILVVRFGLRKWVIGPLNELNEQLRCENKEQQNFLAMVSHELRTPLSSIIAFVDLWDDEQSDQTIQEKQLVREIKENSRTLLDLINNTIDTAKLEAGEFGLYFDEVDLIDVIQSVTSALGPLAHKKRITITKHVDPNTPIIVSDASALNKILTNIIANAVKYSPEETTVSIRAFPEGNNVRITVTDEGPGISPEQQKRIFSRYKRVAGSSVSGSGLGLYLAKSLTEQLGGDILLDSVVGKGSMFSVELPQDGRLVSKSGEEE